MERGVQLAEPGRGTGSIEAEFLNGEVVLLGALHGVATPVNALLQRWPSRRRSREATGDVAPEQLREMAGLPRAE